MAIGIGALIAFLFRAQIVHLLTWPFSQYMKGFTLAPRSLVVTGSTEGLLVVFTRSLAVGFLFALPVVLYQTWTCITVICLQQRSRKCRAFAFVCLGLLLLVAGLCLGVLCFFAAFASESVTSLLTAHSYVGCITMFLLTFCLAFEIPLILMFLAQIGAVTPMALQRKRRVMHILLWGNATFLMPGSEVWNPVILGVTMSELYELSIVFIRWRGEAHASLEASSRTIEGGT